MRSILISILTWQEQRNQKDTLAKIQNNGQQIYESVFDIVSSLVR